MKSVLISEKIKCSYIRKHPLFRYLDEEHFEQICSKAKLVKLKKNTPFLLNNEPASKVFFLAGGIAKLVGFNGPGGSSLRDILVNDGVFGDFSFAGFGMDGYVTGLTKYTYMFYFVASELKKILQHHQILSLNYAESMGVKLRRIEERLLVCTNKDARLRLLFFFQGWASLAGVRMGQNVILENYLTLNDIAELIGVSRQFIYTMLKELKDQGLVYYDRKQIELADSFLSQNLNPKKQVI